MFIGKQERPRYFTHTVVFTAFALGLPVRTGASAHPTARRKALTMLSVSNIISRLVPLTVLFAVLTSWPPALRAEAKAPLPDYVIKNFGTPPAIPEGPLPEALQAAVNTAFIETMKQKRWEDPQTRALDHITKGKDPRIVWLIADLIRFTTDPELTLELAWAASKLLGIEAPYLNHWGKITDHLIAWDVPAPPDYLRVKRAIFTTFVPEWEKLFVDGEIDWRHVSWGGVQIDNRAFNATAKPCDCIPAADNPAVTSAKEATWLKDDDIVFGIGINGEYRAHPRRIMEVREMVNDTLGGRHLGIPYCTLCGAAQAYFTDRLPDGIERPVLRTSGLLIRSNKVMFDVNTYSVFDTFKGNAVTGPLAAKKLQLKQASVVTTDWGTWKKKHPGTTVLVEALALGNNFDFRNGRDADGPIFPVGDVDPRLPVQEDIIGVIAASGKPVAFQRTKAMVALKQGQRIAFENIRLQLEAGGIKAVGADGADLGSHQAFWFAWSQFYPETELWAGTN